MAEITEILTKLAGSTDQGKIDWKPTANERAFMAAIGNLSVVIRSDADDEPILQILDSSGREIDRLEGWTYSGSGELVDWKSNLLSLHWKARRIALDVDTKLDELLKSLETGFIDDLSRLADV